MQTPANNDEKESGRWVLIRDVAVFQIKLLMDGFRDLLLVPVSLVTGIVSLFNYRNERGSEFYDLLRLGRRSEIWINLFGAAKNAESTEDPGASDKMMSMDEVVAKVENYIVDEYHKGGVTAQAKERLDKALDSLSALADRNNDNSANEADRQ